MMHILSNFIDKTSVDNSNNVTEFLSIKKAELSPKKSEIFLDKSSVFQ